jgi:hypothetical protein
LGLQNELEWRTVERPNNIPRFPDKVYSGQWVSWGDWLGTDNVSNAKRIFVAFEEARATVRSVTLKNMAEWREWRKTARHIPSQPQVVYKDQWVSWGDWLGTGRTQKKTFLPFTEGRAYVRSIGLKGTEAWCKWSKAERPENIPSSPQIVYKDEWVSWGDWLGTGKACRRARVFLPYKEASAFVRSIKLKNVKEWFEWAKSLRPDSIPSNPQNMYKDEWVSWSDWLGTAERSK